jgi:hypothetical protein
VHDGKPKDSAPHDALTVQRLVSDLMLSYPRQHVTGGNHAAYVRALSDLPLPVLAEAVERCVRAEEWLPTVAVVRRTAAEIMLALPTEADALAQIQERQRWARDPSDGVEDVPPPPPVHPLVQSALDRVGGWHAFRVAENAEVIRGQFGRIFRDARAEEIRRAQVGR